VAMNNAANIRQTDARALELIVPVQALENARKSFSTYCMSNPAPLVADKKRLSDLSPSPLPLGEASGARRVRFDLCRITGPGCFDRVRDEMTQTWTQ